MIRKLSVGVAGLALVASLAKPVEAQGFGEGYLDIGPTIGFGSIGSAGMAFGGRLEKALKPLESLGGGMLGIQVGATYYSWSSGIGAFKYSLKYIPIGVTANYHFKLSDSKLDPFVGLGLGYEIISCDWPGSGFDPCASNAIYFIGRAGARYFFKENMALYGDVGAGGAAINLGIMFKMK